MECSEVNRLFRSFRKIALIGGCAFTAIFAVLLPGLLCIPRKYDLFSFTVYVSFIAIWLNLLPTLLQQNCFGKNYSELILKKHTPRMVLIKKSPIVDMHSGVH